MVGLLAFRKRFAKRHVRERVRHVVVRVGGGCSFVYNLDPTITEIVISQHVGSGGVKSGQYMVGNRWRHCQCMRRTGAHADDALILGLCRSAQSKQSWVRVPNSRGSRLREAGGETYAQQRALRCTWRSAWPGPEMKARDELASLKMSRAVDNRDDDELAT